MVLKHCSTKTLLTYFLNPKFYPLSPLVLKKMRKFISAFNQKGEWGKHHNHLKFGHWSRPIGVCPVVHLIEYMSLILFFLSDSWLPQISFHGCFVNLSNNLSSCIETPITMSISSTTVTHKLWSTLPLNTCH